MKKNKRAFLLLEVSVSIVIVSLVMVLVVRAYSITRSAIKRSIRSVTVEPLLERALFDLEMLKVHQEGTLDGDFSGAPGYYWTRETSGLEGTDIYTVRSRIHAGRSGGDILAEADTYVRDERDEK